MSVSVSVRSKSKEGHTRKGEREREGEGEVEGGPREDGQGAAEHRSASEQSVVREHLAEHSRRRVPTHRNQQRADHAEQTRDAE